jgi:hypothetical protein
MSKEKRNFGDSFESSRLVFCFLTMVWEFWENPAFYHLEVVPLHAWRKVQEFVPRASSQISTHSNSYAKVIS